MKPIYQPKGRAGEYCEWAINIYTGCNHGCTYCYARKMANRWGKDFSVVEPRKGIVESTKKQIAAEKITDREIQLCFTCDPYPADVDTTVTRDIIETIKNSGNHVRILTKGGFRAERDFDLLDGGDWFGVTISGGWSTMEVEPNTATPENRLRSLAAAHDKKIKTWVSCEPVLHADAIYGLIADCDFIDTYKIGKLNYHTPEDFLLLPIDWAAFGLECERLCHEHGRQYYIKEDLRNCMDKAQTA